MIDIRLLALAVLGIGAGFAQDASEQKLEPSPGVELEFIASEISEAAQRYSGSGAACIWKENSGAADFDVGVNGVSWKFRMERIGSVSRSRGWFRFATD